MYDSGQDALVSVVLPTFNRARTLRRAMTSVLSQSYQRLELIVVDDGSTDCTAEIVESMKDPRIRYIKCGVNKGASNARNVGLLNATGDYVAFQDSDDEWLAGKLEAQVSAAQRFRDGSVTVFHTKIWHGLDDRRRRGPHRVMCIPKIDREPSREELILTLWRGEPNPVSTQTLLFSRRLIEQGALFDTCLTTSEDWDLSLKLFKHSQVIFINAPLVVTYLQEDSISQRRKGGLRSQLRVVSKLKADDAVPRQIVAKHLGRLGWAISKRGKRRFGNKVILMAIQTDGSQIRNWVRFLFSCFGLAQAYATVKH